MDVISRKLIITGVDEAITDHRGLATEIKNVKKLLEDPNLGKGSYEALNKRLSTLQEKQREYRKDLRRGSQEAITQGKVTVSAYRKLSTQLNVSRNRLKDYLAVQSEGVKLTKKQEKEFKDLTIQVAKYDKRLKNIDSSVGQNFRNVGNYSSALEGIQNRLIGAFSITAVAAFGQQFISQLREVANEARGVEFAFDRIAGGQSALNNIRQSTRGLLSDLDIKKSINEFDNFNLSLKNADTLFEFVTLRATQTGQSFEGLRNSLVEGLSKQSLRRLDNLGVSMIDLRKEMDSFGLSVNEAFTKLAKAEIAEAGDTLDKAASSTQRLTSSYANFQLSVVNGSGEVTSVFFGIQDALSGILTTITNLNNGRISTIGQLFDPDGIAESDKVINDLENSLIDILKTNEQVEEFATSGGFESLLNAYKEAGFNAQGATQRATEFIKSLNDNINPPIESVKNLGKEIEGVDKKIKKTVQPEEGSMSQLKNLITQINKEINDGNLEDATLIAKLKEIESLEKSITALEDKRRQLTSGDRTVEGVASIGGTGLPSSIESQTSTGDRQEEILAVTKSINERRIKEEDEVTKEIAEKLKEQRQLYIDNASELGTILGTLAVSNRENLKENLKDLGLFLLDSLEKQLFATVSALSLDAAKNAALLNGVGVAKSLAGIAVVKGLFAAARSQIQSAERGTVVDSSGVVKGKRHSNGGENIVINGQRLNVEQGEKLVPTNNGSIAVINRNAASMNKGLLNSFDGAIPIPILSKINQSGGGIPFAERGALIGSVAPRPSQNDVFQQEFINGQSSISALEGAAERGTEKGSGNGIIKSTEKSRKLSDLTSQTKF